MDQRYSTEYIDGLIAEYQRLGDQIKAATARRRAIADQLPYGRTEGTLFDFRRSSQTVVSHYSAYLLKRFVPAATLDLCRTRTTRRGQTMVVPKMKPKKAKDAQNARQ